MKYFEFESKMHYIKIKCIIIKLLGPICVEEKSGCFKVEPSVLDKSLSFILFYKFE